MTTHTIHIRENTKDYEIRRQEKMAQARSVLEDGLDQITRDEEALKRYIRFRAHVRSYSRRNTIMILMQRPTARYCMGYRQWQKHGRQVKKGENGIAIWIPLLRKATEEEVEAGEAEEDEKVLYGWKIGYAFDYQQTKATSEDALTYESPIPKLEGDGSGLYQKLRAAAEEFGFTVQEEDLAKEGYCRVRQKVIGIRRQLPAASKAATLAHELAHGLAHGNADGLSHSERELEAEGAAYLACYALGLDTSKASLPYLAHYDGKDGEEVAERLSRIDEIAWRIVDATE